MKKRIAVFASGFGSNLQALIDYNNKHGLNGDIVLVFSNNKDAFALVRAKKNNIKAVFMDPTRYSSREKYDSKIIEMLEEEKIDLVVLAGYMLLLSQEFVRKFKNKILNIHPALLPSFKGTHGIKDAYRYGVKVTGVTVHFVDEEYDHGPIAAQVVVPVQPEDTPDTLAERVLKQEHRLYSQVIAALCRGEIVWRADGVPFINPSVPLQVE